MHLFGWNSGFALPVQLKTWYFSLQKAPWLVKKNVIFIFTFVYVLSNGAFSMIQFLD